VVSGNHHPSCRTLQGFAAKSMRDRQVRHDPAILPVASACQGTRWFPRHASHGRGTPRPLRSDLPGLRKPHGLPRRDVLGEHAERRAPFHEDVSPSGSRALPAAVGGPPESWALSDRADLGDLRQRRRIICRGAGQKPAISPSRRPAGAVPPSSRKNASYDLIPCPWLEATPWRSQFEHGPLRISAHGWGPSTTTAGADRRGHACPWPCNILA
jgi:hypothetical protein